jgi:hypothetical protein
MQVVLTVDRSVRHRQGTEHSMTCQHHTYPRQLVQPDHSSVTSSPQFQVLKHRAVVADHEGRLQVCAV